MTKQTAPITRKKEEKNVIGWLWVLVFIKSCFTRKAI
jgi:hypothetical protein